MITLTHVLIALSSVGFTTFLYFFPTKSRLIFSNILIGTTIFSGTILVISKPASMIQACRTGLVYIAVMSFATVLVRNKLARQNINNRD